MLHTVSNLRDSTSAILSSIDIDNVANLNAAFERAATVLVQKAYIPEAVVKQNLVLYDGVYDYACDTRTFGTQLNDIRPQGVARSAYDFVFKKQPDDFDRDKGLIQTGTMATYEYQNGVPVLRVASTFPKQKANLDSMSSTTGWTLAGTGSNLAQDVTYFYQSPASLRFNATSGVATLTKSISQQNLASYEDVGVAFLAIQIPPANSASDLTNISLRIGSDASNYDSVTSTTGFLGSWTVGEFLLVAFDFSTATSTGTPAWSAIDYVQVRLTFGATTTSFRVGGLWMSLPTPVQVLSQSSAIFKAGTANTATTVTTNADTIILNEPAYMIYCYESAVCILEQTGAGASDSTMQKIESKLNELYNLYRGENPSDSLVTIGNWYE